jgi:hypothetical protein
MYYVSMKYLFLNKSLLLFFRWSKIEEKKSWLIVTNYKTSVLLTQCIIQYTMYNNSNFNGSDELIFITKMHPLSNLSVIVVIMYMHTLKPV